MLTPVLWSLWLVVPLAIVLVVLNLPPIRRPLLSKFAFRALSKVLPPMSQTEEEALEAGTTWWEKDLFSGRPDWRQDRKSTRLNSSHVAISYAVFCLKKKTTHT